MNKPSLCRACGRLMGTATSCPYCGAAKNSFSTKAIHLKKLLTSNQISYTQMIMRFSIAMYVIEVLVGAFVFRSGLISTIFSGPPGKVLLFLGASSPNIYEFGHWWGPFTASFLHGGLLHIAFNMFALTQVGPLIEHSTSKSFFMLTYIITGVCGFLLSAYGGALSIGGSAALYGLIGCGISISFILGQGKDDPLFRGLITWLIYGFIFALLVPGIDHLAHIGGLIGGLGFGYLWTKVRTLIWFRGLSDKLSFLAIAATLVGFIHSILTFYKYLI